MRNLLLTVVFTYLLQQAAFASPPNVLFILVDDWGWSDAGIQGSDFYETPRIDRFASESLRFTQAYTASPVCSPTRAAVMTGKHPARLDMTIWHEGAKAGGPKNRKLLNAVANPDLPRTEATIAELFKQQGYFTAHIGKWHLGGTAYYPETQGFDVNIGGTYWGAPSTFFYPYRGVWSKSDPELRYVPVGTGKPGDYLTDKLTDHAIDLIREQHERPFFISLWYHTVHTPIEAKEETIARFKKKQPGKLHKHSVYAGMLASLDENVGRLLDTLEQLKLDRNTIVILTSDNGGVDFQTGKSAGAPPTSNAPFRSGKGTLYEGGIRVPLMFRWPDVTQANKVCDEPVLSQDFYPTLAAGIGVPSDKVPQNDGVNLMRLLKGEQQKLEPRKLFWHYPHYYPRMTPASAIRDGSWKLIHYYEDDRVELFDLKNDKSEQTDMSAKQPTRANAMKRHLDQWRESIGANSPTPNPNWKR
ncbi:MAG: sulfatase [Planctomycetaceae bacterium]|nr:sulfatase [Planctomycetaceae bacterium]